MDTKTSAIATLAVSFMTDFILTAGGTITGGMLGAETVAMPPAPVWILAAILGVMAAARRVQALLSLSPTAPGVPVTVTTTTAPTPGLPFVPTTVTETKETKPPGPQSGASA